MTENICPALARQRTIALTAALATVCIVGMLLGLSIPLLSFTLEGRGVSNLFNGLNTAAAAIGMIATAPLVPRLARRFGVRAVMLGALLVGGVSLLGFYFIQPLWVWFPLRLVFGAAVTVLFVLSEYWINAVVSDRRRGLVMALYAMALSLGFAGGSGIVSVTGDDGILPFLIGAALFVLAAKPLLFAGKGAPDLPRKGETRILTCILAAPAAMFAAFIFGAVEMGTLNFMPLYGLKIGFDQGEAALLLNILAAGNVALQVPVGSLADRMDRRLLLLILSSLGAVGAVAMPMLSGHTILFFVTLFLIGGLVAALYTVGLAHLGGRYRGAELANANAAFILCYALGMLVGPPALGQSMDILPPHGLAFAVAAMLATYSAFVILRMLGKPLARLDFARVLRRLRAQ